MGPLRTANGSFAVSLLLTSVLLVGCAVVVSRLKDASPLTARTAAATATDPAREPATGTTDRPAGELAAAVSAPPAAD